MLTAYFVSLAVMALCALVIFAVIAVVDRFGNVGE